MNSEGLVAMSFNNFTAKDSVPMLNKISTRLNFQKEFSPPPNETLELIYDFYQQPNNLVINFHNDGLDQSDQLLKCLRKREEDKSILLELKGNHLTPVSSSFRENILGINSKNLTKAKTIEKIIDSICSWASFPPL